MENCLDINILKEADGFRGKSSWATHDWMNGWIAVLDHPYYAITVEEGAYKITDIPAGTYNLTAWHEKLGRQQIQVTIKSGELTKVNFEFPVK